ncbi:MAG TPA: methionine--tRNA ligase subunit beta, partial [Pseudoxanthomonas sp.]|nr:methionine--tRNA ligase subunit beta [Pseudoxanthomonas sp.]
QKWYEEGNYNFVLRTLMQNADDCNKFWDGQKPWVLAKDPAMHAQLSAVASEVLRVFYIMSIVLFPICPNLSRKALNLFGVDRDPTWNDTRLNIEKIHPFSELFTRIDLKLIEIMTEASKDTMGAQPSAEATSVAIGKPSAVKVPTNVAPTPENIEGSKTISIDDFSKLDLRIGKVLACEFVEGSDKLLRFELDAGELGKRQIFSGIRASYGDPEKLIGRNVVFIANLAPRKMRFGISEGMILSAGFDGGSLALLDADSAAEPGMPVR